MTGLQKELFSMKDVHEILGLLGARAHSIHDLLGLFQVGFFILEHANSFLIMTENMHALSQSPSPRMMSARFGAPTGTGANPFIIRHAMHMLNP